ncbi:unnamed protein product [Parnassius apollo]|uniref:(apollo) hypothetical protein n=1 Tax=Parnassius apollo TaxID=110799 RepID=A0A8S3YB98_PARAO|nr:unnamed protein product [Parnassius apollo]
MESHHPEDVQDSSYALKESKNKITKKIPEDYQRLARYDVVKIGASEKLIIPVKNEGKSDKETENQGNTTDPSKITQSDQEIVIALDKKKQDIGNIRKFVGQSLKKQAGKILALSSVKYPAVNTGDNVVVKIPDVDRVKADDRNIIAVIISQETEGMYKLGTKHGILNQLYAKNQFTVCKETFITVDIVPQHEVTIRQGAK